MTDTVKVIGGEEARASIDDLSEVVASDKFWRSALGDLLEVGKRHAVSISPVLTGSYRASHRVAVEGKVGQLFVDPTARNSVSGALVTDYAGVLEHRQQVYGRTLGPVNRLAAPLFLKRIEDVD